MKSKMFKRIRQWWYRRQVAQAVRILQVLDVTMSKAGYDRGTRRRFWRAMHSDRGAVIKILKEIHLSSTGPS